MNDYCSTVVTPRHTRVKVKAKPHHQIAPLAGDRWTCLDCSSLTMNFLFILQIILYVMYILLYWWWRNSIGQAGICVQGIYR